MILSISKFCARVIASCVRVRARIWYKKNCAWLEVLCHEVWIDNDNYWDRYHWYGDFRKWRLDDVTWWWWPWKKICKFSLLTLIIDLILEKIEDVDFEIWLEQEIVRNKNKLDGEFVIEDELGGLSWSFFIL